MKPITCFLVNAAFASSLLAQPLTGPPVVVEEVTETVVPAGEVVEREVTETVSPAGEVVEREVTEIVQPGERVVEETVVERPVVTGEFNPRRQLDIVPRVLPAEPVPAPGTTVETTETVTRVGGRVYNTERNVVIVEGRELPYATIPVLFVKGTAELLDSESRAALEETAAAINDVARTNPDAKFDIEGHTSTDGTPEMNMQLSAARARRVLDELTLRYNVPASALSARGFGENYPSFPEGSEAQMILDRRVLVVRSK